jgi:hypothetical protein
MSAGGKALGVHVTNRYLSAGGKALGVHVTNRYVFGYHIQRAGVYANGCAMSAGGKALGVHVLFGLGPQVDDRVVVSHHRITA